MELVLVTCVVGLVNIFGMKAVSDEHLVHQGVTPVQLNSEAPKEQKEAASLLEAIQSKEA